MFDGEEHGDTQKGRDKIALGSLIIGSSGSAEVKPCPRHLDSGNKVSQKRMAMGL